MKVHQPGSHLMDERGAKVADWSWRQSLRRLRVLARLAAPYRLRAAAAVVALLAATAAMLAPPYLAKVAIDRGIRGGDTTVLAWTVLAGGPAVTRLRKRAKARV